MEYVRRILDTELDELFDQVSAIAIDGPKGVGKTYRRTAGRQRGPAGLQSRPRVDRRGTRAGVGARASLVDRPGSTYFVPVPSALLRSSLSSKRHFDFRLHALLQDSSDSASPIPAALFLHLFNFFLSVHLLREFVGAIMSSLLPLLFNFDGNLVSSSMI